MDQACAKMYLAWMCVSNIFTVLYVCKAICYRFYEIINTTLSNAVASVYVNSLRPLEDV